MDSSQIVVFFVVIPWSWILMQLVIFGNFLNVVPLSLLGCLLYWLEKEIRKESQDQQLAKKKGLIQTKDSCSETEQVEFIAKSTQTDEEKGEVDVHQSSEHSTKSAETNGKNLIESEYSEFDESSTESKTDKKHIQTLRHKKKRGFKIRSCVLWKKKSQSKTKSSKPKLPTPKFQAKKVSSSVKIATAEELLSYHQEKHNYLRRYFKITPLLDQIPELEEPFYESDSKESEMEPKNFSSSHQCEIESQISEFGENVNKKHSRNVLQSEDSIERELSEMIQEEIWPKFCKIMDHKEVNCSENCNVTTGVESEPQPRKMGENMKEENFRNDLLQSEDFSERHFSEIVQDGIRPKMCLTMHHKEDVKSSEDCNSPTGSESGQQPRKIYEKMMAENYRMLQSTDFSERNISEIMQDENRPKICLITDHKKDARNSEDCNVSTGVESGTESKELGENLKEETNGLILLESQDSFNEIPEGSKSEKKPGFWKRKFKKLKNKLKK